MSEDKTVRLTVRVSQETYRRWRIATAEKDTNTQQALSVLVEEYVGNWELHKLYDSVCYGEDGEDGEPTSVVIEAPHGPMQVTWQEFVRWVGEDRASCLLFAADGRPVQDGDQ